MEQHYHTSTIGDGIIQTHLFTTSLVGLKVADSVEDQLLLLFRENHLHIDGQGGTSTEDKLFMPLCRSEGATYML